MDEMNRNKIGDFIEGNNSLAFWVAKDIINGSLRYNPTYFYGETCTGKTLLLKGIEKELRNKYPEKKVIYWDSEAYVNTFVNNLRSQESKRLYDFKRKKESPNEITRLEILRAKAIEKNINLNPEIMNYIADCVHNAGALWGALNRLAILDSQELHQLNVERVRELLVDIVDPEKRKLTVQSVIHGVSEYYKIPRELLVKKSRNRSIALMRQMVMYISMKKIPGATYKMVAEALDRDHSTIINGIRSMEKKLDTEEGTEIKKDMQIICDRFI